MPPPGTGPPLGRQEIEQLRLWVDTSTFNVRTDRAGAERQTFTEKEAPPVTDEDRRFWAFRKPVKQPLPAVKNQDRVRTPIDAYALAKLEAKGLTFSPDAPQETLLRRAYFDLLGLPPTLAEIDEFLSDTRPDAYERLIDRLLASPHYGERWGRYWLDTAGYTDTAGAWPNAPTTRHRSRSGTHVPARSVLPPATGRHCLPEPGRPWAGRNGGTCRRF